MTLCRPLTDSLRQHVRDAEVIIAELNRRLAEARATGRPTAALLGELVMITGRRNFMLARLMRADGVESQHSAPATDKPAPTLRMAM